LGVDEFVNADAIASGLSAFDPEGAAMAAGRAMLARIRELADHRLSFAFETTLASRSFEPWLRRLIATGYRFQLVFLWLPSAEFAIRRVRARVRLGGHDVPEETVRRRYDRGLWNFFKLYRPLAATWRIYDNSRSSGPRLVASGRGVNRPAVYDQRIWRLIRQGTRDEDH
jgi:predicted ABC-type ATPase